MYSWSNMKEQLTQAYGSLRTNHFVGKRGLPGWSIKMSVEYSPFPSCRPLKASQRSALGGRRAKDQRVPGHVDQAECEVQAPVAARRVDLADDDLSPLIDPRLAGMRHPLQQFDTTHALIAGDLLPAKVLDTSVVVELDIAGIPHICWSSPEVLSGEIGRGHREASVPEVIVRAK